MGGRTLPRGLPGRLGGVLTFGMGLLGVVFIAIGVSESDANLWIPGIVIESLALVALTWSVRLLDDVLVAGPCGLPVRRWRLSDVVDVRLGALPVKGCPACVEVVTERWTAKLWSSFGIFDDRRAEWLDAIATAAGLDGPGEDRRGVRNDAYSAFFEAVSLAPAMLTIGVVMSASDRVRIGMLFLGLALGVGAWNVASFRRRHRRELASALASTTTARRSTRP